MQLRYLGFPVLVAGSMSSVADGFRSCSLADACDWRVVSKRCVPGYACFRRHVSHARLPCLAAMCACSCHVSCYRRLHSSVGVTNVGF